MPVAVTLASAGHARSEAWFRFEPEASQTYRFSTDSHGPDPAIQIFSSCKRNTVPLAANDDELGLDATAFVDGARGVLFVHVANSGGAGTLIVNVAANDGAITGTITDSMTGLPLQGVAINASNTPFFSFDYFATTDQSGNYSVPVMPGNYYVVVTDSTYVSQIYPNIPCRPGFDSAVNGCPTANAQVVTVADSATVANINFVLDHGHQIAGQVRDTANKPIAASIALYNDLGQTLVNGSTDAFGRYSFQTLPPGSYEVSAQANGYGSQIFSGVSCGGTLQMQCDPTQGTTIAISDHDALGIDFALQQLAAIHGTLTGTGSQRVIGYVSVVDAYGSSVFEGYSDPDGNYIAGPLSPGTYYVYAQSSGYFAQIFDGIDCAQDCATSTANATVININKIDQQAEANFQLDLLPVVHGHVKDATSNLPLPGVLIAVSNNPPATFNQLTAAATDINGDFVLENVPAGK